MEERRRFFRLDDEVVLDFRTLTPDELHQQRHITEHLNELDELEQDIGSVLHQVRSHNPLVGKALDLLNEKMNLLLNHQRSGLPLSSVEQLTRVNLSACGMSFTSPEQPESDQPLMLTMQLKPSNATLNLTGRIVGMHPVEDENEEDDEGYRIRVEFEGLQESQQELLIQHLFQLQNKALKKRSEDQV